jgi:hypothetical protein
VVASPAGPIVDRAAPFLPHAELTRMLTNRCARTRACRVISRGPAGPPPPRNPPWDCYCRKVWPGGIFCLPKGAAAPDKGAFARVTVSAAGKIAPNKQCYGQNLAGGGDLGGSGTFFGDLGAREAGAALTERALQDIATADALFDAGRLDAAGRDTRKSAAAARARTALGVAAVGRAPSAPPAPATRGYDGRIIKATELAGICGGPKLGPVWCRTRWPGGFRGVDAEGNEPQAPEWVPATEERSTVDVRDAKTGVVTTINVSRLIAGPECYPNGKPFWTRGGAWAVRAGIEIGEGTAALARSAARTVALRVRQLGALTQQSAAEQAAAAGTTPGAPKPQTLYCRTVWPGGVIGVDEGATPPSGPWVPAPPDQGPPCFRV